MSIVLGFAFELQALRRITPHTAGMLFALDPAVGFVFGLLVLYQSIGLGDLLGMSWLWSPQRASRSKS